MKNFTLLSAAFSVIILVSSMHVCNAQRSDCKNKLIPKITAIDRTIKNSFDTLEHYRKLAHNQLPVKARKSIRDDSLQIEKLCAEVTKISYCDDTLVASLVQSYVYATGIYTKSTSDLSRDVTSIAARNHNTISFEEMELIKENLLANLFGGTVKIEKDNDFNLGLNFGYFAFLSPSISDPLGLTSEDTVNEYENHIGFLLNLDYNVSRYLSVGFSFRNIPEQGFTAKYNDITLEERIVGTAVGFHVTGKIISRPNMLLTASIGLNEAFFSEHSSITSQVQHQVSFTHTTDTFIQVIRDSFNANYYLIGSDTSTYISSHTFFDTTDVASYQHQAYASHPSSFGVYGAVAFAYYPNHSRHLSLNLGLTMMANSSIVIRQRDFPNGDIPEVSMPLSSIFISGGIGLHF